jgi:hypothetical protein
MLSPVELVPTRENSAALNVLRHSGGRDAVIRRIEIEPEAMAVLTDTILRLILEREIFS